MSKVIRFIVTNQNDKHFEASIVNGDWHAFIIFPEPRSICGIQMDGDDGYMPSLPVDGMITCAICKGIIKAIKAKY